jgi:glutathione synthase/RimK-type ligase-like ATP-grasp enzyme
MLTFRGGSHDELDRRGGFSLVVNDEPVDDVDVAGVWNRRPVASAAGPDAAAPHVREFCRLESRALLHGWLQSLGSRVMNPLGADIASAWKPYQLRAASQLGLDVPITVISNRPDDVRELVSRKRQVVFKVLAGTSREMTETRKLEAHHLDELYRLAQAPVIFQELVDGLDVRVTIVDDAVFPVEIESTHPGARLDWRLDGAPAIRPHRLPNVVRERLVAFCRHLGLRYAAMDLRRTVSGQYLFFEVNPAGQFLFAEIEGGQPISDAVAGALLQPPGSARSAVPGRLRVPRHLELR